ncbi:hypothetical protein PTKU64_30520 [Paraburkholderia terrae]|uniref:Methyltransferase FkbM domain-containing protein n=2 Tax=Paraburkholderia terrae TaxID=311230 RepID=A0ABM7TK15_9BURK|nr:hypothetical protein PTKU64_30520 [Paraburkholderia terrae]
MIINRNDYNATSANSVYGLGHQIFSKSSFDASEVDFMLGLLSLRRQYFGDGVFAIDGGANVGVHSVEWARHMYGWGQVLSFEAQEVVYYALAGNIVLNNCLNARAKLAALSESVGELTVPRPDYFASGSFGSLELRKRVGTEFIGQPISYDQSSGVTVPTITIDSLNVERVDLIKLDIEGMEIEALRGAVETILKFKPMISIEVIKSDQEKIKRFFTELGYQYFPAGLNLIAVHSADPSLQHLSLRDGTLYLR